MHNTLERHKFFPYIAWGTIILFAFFVFQLTQSVSAQIKHIETATTQVHQPQK